MPTYATQSVKPSDILTALVTKIQAATGLPAQKVRRVTAPDPDWDIYVAEANVAIRLRPPEPFAYSGAGRAGLRIERTAEVFVMTVNLRDVAGTSTQASIEHYDLEDVIIDALVLRPPDGSTGWGSLIYQGGGDVPKKLVRDDPGFHVSCLLFGVSYSAALTVVP